MPPARAEEQPPPALRAEILTALEQVLVKEANAQAGEYQAIVRCRVEQYA